MNSSIFSTKSEIVIVILVTLFTVQLSYGQSIIHFQNWEGQPGAGNWFGLETTNEFIRGTDAAAVNKGSKAIYISNNDATYGYDQNTPIEAYLNKVIEFPVSTSLDVEVTFDWKCFGEVGFDYMKVYIVDNGLVNPTESAIASYGGFVYELNSGIEFSGQATFTTFNETLPTTVEGRSDLQLVFTWTNDGSISNGVPAAIDNIIVSLGPPITTLSGDYLVGSDASAYFATLTEATYFLNSYGLSNNVRFLLTDATYNASTEFFPIEIENFNGNPPSPSANSYTFTLQPNAGVDTEIVGSVNGAAISNGTYKGLITLNKSDNVIIEGSNSGSTSRNLTLTNTNTSDATGIMVLSDNPDYNENITIQNVILDNEYSTNTTAYAAGIAVINTVFTAANAGFDNVLIQNNQFIKGNYGVYIVGGLAGNINGNNLTVQNNDMEQTGANAIFNRGIYVGGVNNASILGNQIGSFNGTTGQIDYGIYLVSGVTNTTVEKNEIHDLVYTGTSGYASNGIRVSTTTSSANILIKNNVIYGISGDGEDFTNNTYYAFNPFGILLTTTQSGIDIYNNSIYLNGNDLGFSANAVSACVVLNTGSTADIRNNIFFNELGLSGTTGLGSFGVIARGDATQFEAIDYNDYYSNALGSGGNFIGRIGTTNYTTLAAWQAATTQDNSSISANPAYTSATDLKPDETNANAWNVNGTGVQIAKVADDYEGNTRSITVAAGAPDLGAYEVTPSSIPNNATVSGSHTLGGTEVFTVANRPIAEITWGNVGTLPTVNYLKYYSGRNPENINPLTAEYMNSYVDINTLGGSGYTYQIKFYYDEALLGIISSEIDLRLSKYDGSEWITYEAMNPDVAANTVTVAGLSSFSIFTGSDINNTLPVELLYFSGTLTERGYLLEWETLTETNNNYFQVERSTDAQHFEIVERIDGNGTSFENNYYHTIDGKKINKKVYFRLKQVDYDGKETLSKIISINPNRAEHYYDLFPNPATSYIRVDSDVLLDNAMFQVYSSLGVRVDESNYEIEKSLGDVIIKIEDLAVGVYLLEIYNGGDRKLIKFIRE